MSGPAAPRWVRAFLESTLPSGYGDEVGRDLERDARRRLGARASSGLSVHVWYLRQVLSPSMVLLIWTLRTREDGMGRDARAARVGRRLGEAVRSLRRSPLFAAAAVASLSLGIGANAATFSVVNAVLLRPPSYEEPDDLVFVWNQLSGFDLDRLPLSGIQILELRGEHAVFEDVAGIWATSLTMSVDERAVLASSGLVTPNFFSVLGVEPVLGRTFGEDEGTGTGPTVILSHEFWSQELGGDAAALGRTIELEGASGVVIGILPADFKLVFPPAVGIPERLDVYRAFPWEAASRPQGSRFLRTVARVRPGVSIETADATVRNVAERLRATYTHMAEAGDDFFVAPLRADSVRRIRPVLVVLMGGVGIFLLLTAVNVASLFLARTGAREREFAVRTCLGASRRNLWELLAAEIVMLVVIGTALGLVIGGWGVEVLWGLRPEGIARVDELGLDPLVLGCTAVAASLAAAVAAFGPLARLRRPEPMQLLRFAGTGAASSTARKAIIVAEFALGVVLVVGAGLLGQTLARMQATELGFNSERVLTFRVGLPERRFPRDGERAELAGQLEDELLQLPGVVAAGGGSHIPLADWANWSDVAAPEETPESERDRFHFDHRAVTPGYLPALGAELVSGRHFRTDDVGSNQPVIIVDAALAERAFPGQDPVGKRVIASRYVNGNFVPTPAVIVGVIRNLRDHSPKRESHGQVYWPFAQSARWELTYAVRTEGDPTVLAGQVRELASSVNPDLAVANVRTLGSYVDDALGETRFTSLLGGVFSALALILAGLGLYGVVSYSTLRRSKELGLRLTLGAQGRDLFFSVLREGLLLGAVGVAIGLVGAGMMTRYLSTLLFEVDPLDPVVFGGVGIVLLALSILASAGPALRASRLDPIRSIQVE